MLRLEILERMHKNVVLAFQSSILANIYASLCKSRDPNSRKYFAILKAAVGRADECPITLEPLTYSAVVTSCNHVFSKEGLLKWATDARFDCPVCKQVCEICFPMLESL